MLPCHSRSSATKIRALTRRSSGPRSAWLRHGRLGRLAWSVRPHVYKHATRSKLTTFLVALVVAISDSCSLFDPPLGVYELVPTAWELWYTLYVAAFFALVVAAMVAAFALVLAEGSSQEAPSYPQIAQDASGPNPAFNADPDPRGFASAVGPPLTCIVSRLALTPCDVCGLPSFSFR